MPSRRTRISKDTPPLLFRSSGAVRTTAERMKISLYWASLGWVKHWRHALGQIVASGRHHLVAAWAPVVAGGEPVRRVNSPHSPCCRLNLVVLPAAVLIAVWFQHAVIPADHLALVWPKNCARCFAIAGSGVFDRRD